MDFFLVACLCVCSLGFVSVSSSESVRDCQSERK